MADNEKIKIVFNGTEHEVDAGGTVIQAADALGICIPRFCYLEKLAPLGGCRMCLVALEGVPKLQTACTTPTRDGMQVVTESEEISRARKAMLEFLLVQHPLDCFYCDKASECDLQDLTYQYGTTERRFDFPKEKGTLVYENPLIERNLDRCVHCERCIRACRDIQGAHALSATGRGHHTDVREVPGGGECQFCGHCIDVCPVGANMDRLFTYGGRPFQMETADTLCPYCGVGCTLTMNTRDGKLVRVRAGTEGVNRGSLCARGRFGWGFVHDGGRLTRPLVRKQGKLVEVDWDEALLYLATRLEKIVQEHGAQAVGGIGSPRLSDESNYLFQRFMRAVVGTNHIDSSARLHYTAGLMGRLGFNGDVREATLEDVRQAARVVIIGADPVETNPVLGLAIKKSVLRGGKMVVADPRSTLTGKLAAHHVRIHPGGELALILALGGRLLGESAVADLGEAELLQRAGIGEDDMERLVAMLTKEAGGETVILAGRGVTQGAYGATAVAMLARLAAAQGALFLLTSDRNNERGSCEMGVLPDRLPGLRPLSDKGAVETIWGKKIPDWPGLSLYDMLEAARDGKIKALYVVGEHPISDFPDSKYVEAALNSLDFLVIQDTMMTPTAAMADVVLPTVTFAEQRGSFTNMEGRVQSFVPLISIQGDGRPDGRIFVDLARKMGRQMPFQNLTDVQNEIDAVVPRDGERPWKR
ncbi:MAG: molybdopterin-dependent oxidoreductase, partial [bacterium]|nr:molybdopterin-dependent oxidoreductase [bacterium]